jgi:ssDNA thymidine ADP-ribosyltransferase, DarT
VPLIYHFTDGRNLEPILAAGELRAHALARESTRVEIADAGIKKWRETRQVSCGPGGFVCDYVPFYFAPRSPMLFSISKDNVEGVDPDQRPIVYLVSSTELVVAAGLPCVFADGNAAKVMTEFSNDLARLDEMIDWPLMATRYWHNTEEDGDRVRRRMAEFLVGGPVPLDLVTEIAVYDIAVAERVAEMLRNAGAELPVNVRRDWYF